MSTQFRTQARATSQPTSSLTSVRPNLIQRKCACGGTPGLDGECPECRAKRLQRRAVGQSTPAEVPSIVHEVLRSSGQPLDTATRAYMEPHFGHDFGRVRVHTDEKAAESAQAVDALAYTVGRDMVFGVGQYAPGTAAGRRLLAHELTHVVQQGMKDSSSFDVSEPSSRAEQEADFHARAIAEGQSIRLENPAIIPATLARRFVPPPPPVLAPPVQTPQPRIAPGSIAPGSPGGALPTPESPRVGPAPSDKSFYAQYERAKRAPNKEGAIAELETPVATLERGGSPPIFVTISEPRRADVSSDLAGNFTVYYRPHRFHLLDAMEHDIAAVKSNAELIDVYGAYFPDSFLRFGRRFGASVSSGASITLRKIPFPGPIYEPQQLDPGGDVRTPIFLKAAQTKGQQNPAVSMDPLFKAILQELAAHEAAVEARASEKEREARGPCQQQPVRRSGGSKAHNDYADKVTGQTQDFLIVAPSGRRCQTDGLQIGPSNVVWEVKTRHEWATSYGLMGSIYAPRIQDIIFSIEEQKNRCLEVTSRCGFTYRYAFETAEAADFMKKLWGNKPEVFHR